MIKGFDGIRALAVIVVFFNHWTAFGRGYHTGDYGVWTFFVLSGFLIIRASAQGPHPRRKGRVGEVRDPGVLRTQGAAHLPGLLRDAAGRDAGLARPSAAELGFSERARALHLHDQHLYRRDKGCVHRLVQPFLVAGGGAAILPVRRAALPAQRVAPVGRHLRSGVPARTAGLDDDAPHRCAGDRDLHQLLHRLRHDHHGRTCGAAAVVGSAAGQPFLARRGRAGDDGAASASRHSRRQPGRRNRLDQAACRAVGGGPACRDFHQPELAAGERLSNGRRCVISVSSATAFISSTT